MAASLTQESAGCEGEKGIYILKCKILATVDARSYARSAVSATTITWPILRPLRTSVFPYKYKCTPGIARSCSQAGVTTCLLRGSGNQTSPKRFNITARSEERRVGTEDQ